MISEVRATGWFSYQHSTADILSTGMMALDLRKVGESARCGERLGMLVNTSYIWTKIFGDLSGGQLCAGWTFPGGSEEQVVVNTSGGTATLQNLS